MLTGSSVIGILNMNHEGSIEVEHNFPVISTYIYMFGTRIQWGVVSNVIFRERILWIKHPETVQYFKTSTKSLQIFTKDLLYSIECFNGFNKRRRTFTKVTHISFIQRRTAYRHISHIYFLLQQPLRDHSQRQTRDMRRDRDVFVLSAKDRKFQNNRQFWEIVFIGIIWCISNLWYYYMYTSIKSMAQRCGGGEWALCQCVLRYLFDFGFTMQTMLCVRKKNPCYISSKHKE